MKKYQFKKIDAFTTGLSSGNPAGCVYLNAKDEITTEEMQKIATDLKGFVNEVIYLFPENDTYFLKYYSSECEVDFCGHGTIAIMYDFIKNNPLLQNKPEINIRVKDEILSVKNNIVKDNSIYIYAPSPKYLTTNLTIDDIAIALNIEKSMIDLKYKIDLINGGLNTLIVSIKDLEYCLTVLPDQAELRKFCLNNNIDIILIFTENVFYKENNFRTRVFAPKFGYLEDPATGSGNAAFGYYLLKEKLWDGKKLIIEQSSNKNTPNIVKLTSSINNNNLHILFGGSAIVRIAGEYILY
ncbi:MAG: phenazine biosynthesis protein PhzF [Spirochaetes bacterium GWD1_27_9]|nr:MAG: phenazine biosynthesis protein PhzF [Spirochaetes bacterium GWB1_27_13]OHD23203.1 MAG: phenazine biosynthesis protein PhzF [Spirochaetes bacterium GWC1_27_15]OHD34089.1 MAG: phenazine biosynthesis protein PhzF [Spirochaetes bacterium GWD1_27_9]